MSALEELEAEAAVLGCALTGARWEDVGMLRPDDFARREHALVYEAMRFLRTQGKDLDHVTVAERLKAMGRLAEVGGPAALMALDRKPVLQHVSAYVSAVRVASCKREVQRRAQALVAAAHDPQLSDVDLLSRAQAAFQGLSAGEVDEAGDADVWELVDRWDTWLSGDSTRLPYLPHGLSGLRPDAEGVTPVSPGYPMSLSVVGGQSGVGKTSVAATEIAHFLFTLGLPGAVAGLEDGTEWLTRRLLARELGIPFGRVGACRLNDWQQAKLEAWCARYPAILKARLRRWPKSLDSPQLLAKIEQWKQWGARWVWIDHGLRVRYRANGRERLDLLINETTEALAELARPTRSHPGLAIVVNWHLNRDNEDESIPRRGHFKEAGYLDANARYMVGVWQQARRPGFRLFTGVKANYAREGWTVAVPLDEEAGLFRDSGAYVVDFEQEVREAAAAREVAKHGRKMFG